MFPQDGKNYFEIRVLEEEQQGSNENLVMQILASQLDRYLLCSRKSSSLKVNIAGGAVFHS